MSVYKPDTLHSRDNLDFGKGFYLTTIHAQAVSYAQRFARRRQESWLNVYALEYEPSDWKILRLDTYDAEWLDF